MSIKFLVLGGGILVLFLLGGETADSIFMGAGIFLKSTAVHLQFVRQPFVSMSLPGL